MSRPLRALLVGPVVSVADVSGLHLALNDVADQLRAHGWQVDAPIYALPATVSGRRKSLAMTVMYSGLQTFQRWSPWLRLRGAIGARARLFIAMFFMPRRFFANASNNLYWLEERLAVQPAYDVVLLCVDGSAPGMARLLAERHPRCVVVSLLELTAELGVKGWPWLRWLAWLHLRDRAHPYLFRRVSPHQLRCAIFASRHWRNNAIEAGLSPKVAHTIYFGVSLPTPLPRAPEVTGRLLWVGRLSPEKGLHVLLKALPCIGERFKGVTLTVIAAQGPSAYRNNVTALIKRLGLESVVTWRSPVERALLQMAYAEHDVLFFHSVFPEPVALVLMEAFAAGIPVVASQAAPDARLVQDETTCLCYRPGDTSAVVNAVVRLLTDGELRGRLTSNAQQLVQTEFTLGAMGRAYDALLRQCVIGQRQV